MFAAPRTLADLGFSRILAALSERCLTSMGQQRANARGFLANADEVRTAHALVKEARALADEEAGLSLGGLSDIREPLERAAKHAMLEPRELSQVAQLLAGAGAARRLLEARRVESPQLFERARRLPVLPALEERLTRSFEPSGEISDEASEALKEARQRTRGLHGSIKRRLDELLADAQFAQSLRDGYYSVRNDRYVVPVLAQERARVPGTVHNASQSGQTLFVEPQQLIGLGNDLAIAQSLVLEEERRILQELSEQVGAEAGALAGAVEAVAELDEAGGAARLMADLGAAVPAVEPADGALELSGLRHPLLALTGAAVVPNDLTLASPRRALVLSGPNAGGKTVTLTAVGLCAAMTRAGLPVPAGGDSRLPLFDSIHAAVGDAQDLGKGLSTFSAHVARLKEIAEQAQRGSLVLVDEIAADTDPREGAALAVAVLEDLIERGALVLVTTHLEEVKALAHLDPRFQNARVGFDAARMAPTYRLQLGMAGQSSAIELAQRMGLSDRICQRARELAVSSGGPLANALAATERERQGLEAELERAQAATREAQAAREAGIAVREAERRGAVEREASQKDALAKELARAAEEMRELISALRERPALKAVSAARQEALDRAEAAEASAEAARASVATPPAPVVPLQAGGRARHKRLGQTVEILELDGAEAVVSAGRMKMRVPVSELVGVVGQKAAATFPTADKARIAERAEQAAAAELDVSAPRCDIRGMRADDAIREVERFMDRLVREGHDGGVILHGHGTGALKLAVRAALDASPYVRMFRPGDDHEGGDAVTIVAFRS